MVASSALLREQGFAEAKRLCYTGLDSPTLLHEVAGRLGRVVPFEAFCAWSNDPLSGLMTHLMHDGDARRKRRTHLPRARLLRGRPGPATQDGKESVSGSTTLRSYRWEARARPQVPGDNQPARSGIRVAKCV